MSRAVLLLAGGVLALNGCVTVKPVQLPNGTAGHALTCGTVAKCMNEAAKMCGGPYQVIETQNQEVMANGYGGSQTEMVISCGEAPPGTNPKP